MPASWDPDLHKEGAALREVREANRKAFEETKEKLRELGDKGHDVQNMRNWVIKSLVGFNITILKYYGTYYPEMEDDFLNLSYELDRILKKCREANRKITQK